MAHFCLKFRFVNHICVYMWELFLLWVCLKVVGRFICMAFSSNLFRRFALAFALNFNRRLLRLSIVLKELLTCFVPQHLYYLSIKLGALLQKLLITIQIHGLVFCKIYFRDELTFSSTSGDILHEMPLQVLVFSMA